jgi:hypothetical protein
MSYTIIEPENPGYTVIEPYAAGSPSDLVSSGYPTAHWIGRPLENPVENLSGGEAYLDLVQKNQERRRGIFEEMFDPEKKDVPFVGSYAEIPYALGIAKTAEKVSKGHYVSDQELLDLNYYMEFQNRKKKQTFGALVVDIIQGAVAYGSEVAAAFVLAGLLAPEPTTTAIGADIAGRTIAKTAARQRARKWLTRMVYRGLGKKAAKITGKLTKAAARGFAIPQAVGESLEQATIKGFAKATGRKKAATVLGKIAKVGAELETYALLQQALNPARTGQSIANRRLRNALAQGDETVGWSVAKGIMDMNFEYAAEFSGRYLGAAAKRLLPQGVAQKLGRAGIFSWISARNGTMGTKAAWTALNYMGVNNVLEEIGEERVGDFLRGLFGVEGKAGLGNAVRSLWPGMKQLSAEAVAFSALPLMANGLGRIEGGVPYFQAAKNMKLVQNMVMKNEDAIVETEEEASTKTDELWRLLNQESDNWFKGTPFEFLTRIFGDTRRGSVRDILPNSFVQNMRNAYERAKKAQPDNPRAGLDAITEALSMLRGVHSKGILTAEDVAKFNADVKEGRIIVKETKKNRRFFIKNEGLSPQEVVEFQKRTNITPVKNVDAREEEARIGEADITQFSTPWEKLTTEQRNDFRLRWNTNDMTYIKDRYKMMQKVLADPNLNARVFETLPVVYVGTREQFNEEAGYWIPAASEAYDHEGPNGEARYAMYRAAMTNKKGTEIDISTAASEISIVEDMIEAKVKQDTGEMRLPPAIDVWAKNRHTELANKKKRNKREEAQFQMLSTPQGRFEWAVKTYMISGLGFQTHRDLDSHSRQLVGVDVPEDVMRNFRDIIGETMLKNFSRVKQPPLEIGEREAELREALEERKAGRAARLREIVAKAKPTPEIGLLNLAVHKDLRQAANLEGVRRVLREMRIKGVTFSLESAIEETQRTPVLRQGTLVDGYGDILQYATNLMDGEGNFVQLLYRTVPRTAEQAQFPGVFKPAFKWTLVNPALQLDVSVISEKDEFDPALADTVYYRYKRMLHATKNFANATVNRNEGPKGIRLGERSGVEQGLVSLEEVTERFEAEKRRAQAWDAHADREYVVRGGEVILDPNIVLPAAAEAARRQVPERRRKVISARQVRRAAFEQPPIAESEEVKFIPTNEVDAEGRPIFRVVVSLAEPRERTGLSLRVDYEEIAYPTPPQFERAFSAADAAAVAPEWLKQIHANVEDRRAKGEEIPESPMERWLNEWGEVTAEDIYNDAVALGYKPPRRTRFVVAQIRPDGTSARTRYRYRDRERAEQLAEKMESQSRGLRRMTVIPEDNPVSKESLIRQLEDVPRQMFQTGPPVAALRPVRAGAALPLSPEVRPAFAMTEEEMAQAREERALGEESFYQPLRGRRGIPDTFRPMDVRPFWRMIPLTDAPLRDQVRVLVVTGGTGMLRFANQQGRRLPNAVIVDRNMVPPVNKKLKDPVREIKGRLVYRSLNDWVDIAGDWAETRDMSQVPHLVKAEDAILLPEPDIAVILDSLDVLRDRTIGEEEGSTRIREIMQRLTVPEADRPGVRVEREGTEALRKKLDQVWDAFLAPERVNDENYRGLVNEAYELASEMGQQPEAMIGVVDLSERGLEDPLGNPIQRMGLAAETGVLPRGDRAEVLAALDVSPFGQRDFVERGDIRTPLISAEELSQLRQDPARVRELAQRVARRQGVERDPARVEEIRQRLQEEIVLRPQRLTQPVAVEATGLSRRAAKLMVSVDELRAMKGDKAKIREFAEQIHDFLVTNRARRIVVAGLDQRRGDKIVGPDWMPVFSEAWNAAMSPEMRREKITEGDTAQRTFTTEMERAFEDARQRALAEGRTFALEQGMAITPRPGTLPYRIFQAVRRFNNMRRFSDQEARNYTNMIERALAGDERARRQLWRNLTIEDQRAFGNLLRPAPFEGRTFAFRPDLPEDAQDIDIPPDLTGLTEEEARRRVAEYEAERREEPTIMPGELAPLPRFNEEMRGALTEQMNNAEFELTEQQDEDTRVLESIDDIFEEYNNWFNVGPAAFHKKLLEINRNIRAAKFRETAFLDKMRSDLGLDDKAKDMPEGHKDRANAFLVGVGAALDGSNRIPVTKNPATGEITFLTDEAGNEVSPKDLLDAWDEYVRTRDLKVIDSAEVMKRMRQRFDEAREEANRIMNEFSENEWINYVTNYVTHRYAPMSATERQATVKSIIEGTPQAKPRRIPTYQEAAEIHKRVPRTLNALALYKDWNNTVWSAARNKGLVSAAAVLRDVDGAPIVIPIKRGEIPVGENQLIDDVVLEENARNLANFMDEDYDSGASPRANLNRLMEKFRPEENDYSLIDSPLTKSIDQFYVRKGVTENLMKNVLHYGASNRAIVRFIEHFNAWSKFMMLSFSGFHPFALLESLVATFGVNMKNPAMHPWQTGKNITALVQDMKDHPERFAPWIEAGLMVDIGNPDVRLGLIEQDIQRAMDWASRTPGMISKPATMGLNMLNKYKGFIDKWLWHRFHPGIKLHAAEGVYNEWLNSNPQADEFDQKEVREDIARYINDAFGGQEWDQYTWATPQARQILHALVFAPDWTLSAANVSGLTRLPILNKMHVSNLSPLARDQMMRKYWPAMLSIVLFGLPNMWQFGIFLAAGDPEEGDVPFTFMNEAGRRTYIDLTPIMRKLPGYTGGATGKRRQYMRWGKQAYEIFEGWLGDPNMFLRKSSSAVRTAYEQVTGSTVSGWDLPFNDNSYLGTLTTEGKMQSRAAQVVKKFLPISITSAFDGSPTAFIAPQAKGISPGSVTYTMSKTLAAYVDKTELPKGLQKVDLRSIVATTIDAARRNGVDPDIAFKRAKGRVVSKYYREFFDALNKDDMKGMERAAEKILLLGKGLRDFDRSLKARYEAVGRQYTPELSYAVRAAVERIQTRE